MLFAAVAGDFSPLSVDTSGGNVRHAPPALLVAMAVGLGSMDMPIPNVASWEWVNWKFPRTVKAGDTVYARWTLTQKRPPVGGARTAVGVWRVDVHTVDGALCAEGEIGASIFRTAQTPVHAPERAAEAPTAVVPARRRRGRRTGRSAEPQAVTAPPVVTPPPPAAPAADRPSSSRRRRRRRSPAAGAAGAAGAAQNGEPAPAAPVQAPPAPAATPAVAGNPSPTAPASPLSRVMKRLRGS